MDAPASDTEDTSMDNVAPVASEEQPVPTNGTSTGTQSSSKEAPDSNLESVIQLIHDRKTEIGSFLSGNVLEPIREMLELARKYRSDKNALDNPESIELDMIQGAASLSRISSLMAEYEYYRKQVTDAYDKERGRKSIKIREDYFSGMIKASKPPSEEVIRCHLDCDRELVRLKRAITDADAIVHTIRGALSATGELVQVLKRRQDTFRIERKGQIR